MDLNKYQEEQVPSKSVVLLNLMTTSDIKDIVVCVTGIFDSEKDVFQQGCAVVIEMMSGLSVGFSCRDDINAVTLWLERDGHRWCNEDYFENDSEITSVRVSDSTDLKWQSILKEKIDSFYVVKKHRFRNSKYESLSNEVGLILKINSEKYLYMNNDIGDSHNFTINLFDIMPLIDKDF
jgi:hypothetical protein